MVAVVGLAYETMFSTLSTYVLSRTQHSDNIQQAAPSAMISSPTVRVEEIDGCSSNGGSGAERGRQMTSMACTVRILSRAGVRARRERSPIFCAGGTSLETCSCVNLWVPVLVCASMATQATFVMTLAALWRVS